MKILFRKLLRKLGFKWCDGCGRCIWFSKETLRWADGVDYNEDGSPYLTGYTAPACEHCRLYAENNPYG